MGNTFAAILSPFPAANRRLQVAQTMHFVPSPDSFCLPHPHLPLMIEIKLHWEVELIGIAFRVLLGTSGGSLL